MNLVVFLGNPGSMYKKTRHNTGWMVCDALNLTDPWQDKFHSYYIKKGDTIYLKPQTFMNVSGLAVQEAAKFYNIKAQDILVVHDDIELKFGQIKKQLGGGMGGHNGLRSIKQCLGTDQFQRLRIGVGRPEDSNVHIDVATWVISRFSELEEAQLEDILQKAVTYVTL